MVDQKNSFQHLMNLQLDGDCQNGICQSPDNCFPFFGFGGGDDVKEKEH